MQNKQENLKALIVSPYLDHLGGGERYMLEVASTLKSLGYKLYFAWESKRQIQDLTKSLNLKLENFQLAQEIKRLYFAGKPLKMYNKTKKYDVIFYLSDGSIPLLGGRKNYLHMQVPFQNVKGASLKNKLKLFKTNSIVVNSKFTKAKIDKEYKVNSKVIYPPVDLIQPPQNSKEKIILSVGRFEPSLNIKKQNILIKAFKKLSQTNSGWQLVLVGALKDDDREYLEKLKNQAKGYSITFKPNLSYDKLTQLYQKARIFWHGAGYRVNPEKDPELVEHFGITTVEAAFANCIPFVVPKGGQKEIVKNPKLHWKTIQKLAEKTSQAINNYRKYKKFASEINTKKYSRQNFSSKIKNLLL